jgi:methyl-accepting chemotaxis protein
VAEASKEQSQGIGQIATAMSEMDKVTQTNAATAEESASAASQLASQAGTLLNVVNEMDALAHGAGHTNSSEGQSRRRLAANPPVPPPKPRPAVKKSPAASASNSKALPMGDDDFEF